MNQWRTVSISASLLLCCVMSFVAAADVPPEAIAAWREFDQKVSVGQFVMTELRSSKGKVIYKDLEHSLLRKGALVVSSEGASASQRPGKKTLRNGKGTFGLSKQFKDKSWMLSFAEPLANERGDTILSIDAMEILLSLPIRFFGTNLARMSESAETEFSKWEEFSDTDDKQLARFHVVAKEDPDRRIPAGEFKFVVDPKNRFRIVSSEYQTAGGGKYVCRLFYDKALPHYFPEREEIIELDKSGTIASKNIFDIQSITYDPPADEVFELSHYGVEDVEFATKGPSYTWLYATCILLGVFSFGGYLWMRRHTS